MHFGEEFLSHVLQPVADEGAQEDVEQVGQGVGNGHQILGSQRLAVLLQLFFEQRQTHSGHVLR